MFLNRNKKSKKYILSKKVFLFCFIFTLLFSFNTPRTSAALWPTIDPIIRTALDKVFNMVMGMIMGTLKKVAVTSLNKEVGNLVGGASSQAAMFITDYKDFLEVKPEQKAKVYMNDYLSQVTKGKGSLSGYIHKNSSSGLASANYEGVGDGSFAYGIAKENPAYGRMIQAANASGISLSASSGGNYINTLVQGAKNITSEIKTPEVTYHGNPSQMFVQGNFKNMSLYLSGINNPFAFNLNAEQEFQKTLSQEVEKAKTMATAGAGFIGNVANGKVLTPGSIVKESVANAQDLGNKIIAGSTKLPEVLTAVVSQIITQSIQQGIGNIQANINKEINGVQVRAQAETNTQVEQVGPAALYSKFKSR